MRTQYYFQPSDRGLLAWDVHRLVRLSKTLPRKRVPLADIRELDEAWSRGEPVTWRAMIEHIRLMDAADLAYPIILSSAGRVMDGMHRVAKSLREGRPDIEAVQFDVDPLPDHVGRGPDDLPYGPDE
ncbi:MAG TPA: hypothetical protein VFP91_18575 [Vicinamibacterales bacterium]|nr:hypothetical protein [Vicinamibacterales bacterium]